MTYARTCTALLLLTASACVGEFLDVGSNRAASTGTGGSTSSTGTGGALLCTPGSAQSCYGGPEGTEGKGICKAGTQECAADGMSWGECVGEVRPAVEDCATAEDEDCDGKAPACSGALLWARRYGDDGAQSTEGVASDGQGNVLLVGSLDDGTLDFGCGNALVTSGLVDVFVAKLSPEGQCLWSRGFGDGGVQRPSAVAAAADGGVIVVGGFGGEIDFGGGPLVATGPDSGFVVKLDAQGGHVWSRDFFGPNVVPTAVAVGPGDSVIVGGWYLGIADAGGGPLDALDGEEVFVAKLDATGKHLWSKTFPGQFDEELAGLAVDTAGNVWLAGTMTEDIDLGAGPMSSAGATDVFVAKLDPSGALLWGLRAGDESAQTVGRIAVDGAGNAYVTGAYSGVIDFGGEALPSSPSASAYLVKLGPDGHPLWSRSFGEGRGTAVAVDGEGHVVAGGTFSGDADFGAGPVHAAPTGSLYLVKVDGDGASRWSHTAASGIKQRVSSLATDAAGNVLLGGAFKGTLDLGGGALVSTGGQAGAEDVFVAKFAP